MTTIASQIISLTVVYSTVYSDADQRKHQSSASLAFVWGIHRDRWIPRTKSQLRGKCFHLMTSSWTSHYLNQWWPIVIWVIGDQFQWNLKQNTIKMKMMMTMIMRWHILSKLYTTNQLIVQLTHWGRVTHICVNKILTIGSDNGSLPDRRQAIIWTSAGILLIGPLGTNCEIPIEIHTFSFKKIHLKMSSAKWLPFCLGLNVLNGTSQHIS